MNFGYELVVIGLMLTFNALFAAFEMALASISQARLVVLANQKRRGATSALYLKERIGTSLAVIQVGVTLTGAIAAATGGAGVQESIAPRLIAAWQFSPHVAQIIAVILFVIPLSAFSIIFSELVPKIFAIENKEFVCLKLAAPLRVLSLLVWPTARLFERFVKMLLKLAHLKQSEEWSDIPGFHELQAATSLARTKRLFGAQEERIVLSAAQLSRRRIREIILPATEISMIPSNAELHDALIRAHLDLHTRFPICAEEHNPQTIEGYLTFKDLVAALKMHAAIPTVKGIARPIKRLHADLAISQVLEQMMREKLHIALVVSKDDQVLGLITLEDIIEELVGDIEDEADSIPAHMMPTSGGWIMGGGVPMNAVYSRLGIPWNAAFAKESSLRLADWCHATLGRALKKGEIVRGEGLQVAVRKLRRRKLGEAFVSKLKETRETAAR